MLDLSRIKTDLRAGQSEIGWCAVVAIPQDSSANDVRRFLAATTRLYQLRAEPTFRHEFYALDKIRVYRRALQLVLFFEGLDGLPMLLSAIALLQQLDAPRFAAALMLGSCEGWLTPQVKRDIFGEALIVCAIAVERCLAAPKFGVVVFDSDGSAAIAHTKLGLAKPLRTTNADSTARTSIDGATFCPILVVEHEERLSSCWLSQVPSADNLADELLGRRPIDGAEVLLEPTYCDSLATSNCTVIAVQIESSAEWRVTQQAFVDLRSIANEEFPALYGLLNQASDVGTPHDHVPQLLFEYTVTGFRIACVTSRSLELLDWIDSFICALQVAGIPASVGVSHGPITRHPAVTFFNTHPTWVFSGAASNDAERLASTTAFKCVAWSRRGPHAYQRILKEEHRRAPTSDSFSELWARVTERDQQLLATINKDAPYVIGRGWHTALAWFGTLFGDTVGWKSQGSVLAPPYERLLYGNLRRAQVQGILHTFLETSASLCAMLTASALLHKYVSNTAPSFDQFIAPFASFLAGAMIFSLVGAFAFESLLVRRVLPCMDRYQLKDKWQEPYARASMRMRCALATNDGSVVRELSSWSGYFLWADHLWLGQRVRNVLQWLRKLRFLVTKRTYPPPLTKHPRHRADAVQHEGTRKVLPKLSIQLETPVLVLSFCAVGILAHTTLGYVAAVAAGGGYQWALLVLAAGLGLLWQLALLLRSWQPVWSLNFPRRRALRRAHDAALREQRYGFIVVWSHVLLIAAGAATAVVLARADGPVPLEVVIPSAVTVLLLVVNLYLFRRPAREHDSLMAEMPGVGTAGNDLVQELSGIHNNPLLYPFSVAAWLILQQSELLSCAMKHLQLRTLDEADGFLVVDFYGIVQSYGGKLWETLRFDQRFPPLSVQDVFGDGAMAAYLAGQRASHSVKGQSTFFVADLNGPLINDRRHQLVCAVEVRAIRERGMRHGYIAVLRPLSPKPRQLNAAGTRVAEIVTPSSPGVATQLKLPPIKGNQNVHYEKDLFLSYNTIDAIEVTQIAIELERRGLRVWLDAWDLEPGSNMRPRIKEAIETSRVAAIVIGEKGLGPWQASELVKCVHERDRRQMLIIPILLKGGEEQVPVDLQENRYVDLCNGVTSSDLTQLEWGIIGRKPPRK